jgi:O-antigen/teichoic acid export membrane protein
VSIAYGGIISFLFRGVNLVVAFGTVLFTSNALSTDSYGAFALGLAIVGAANAITGGLTAATAYQVSNQGRPVGLALANGLVGAAAVALVGILAGAAAAGALDGSAARMALPVSIAAAAVVLNGVISGAFLGQNQLVRYNVALVLPPAMALIGVLVAVFALDQREPAPALAGYAAGQWAAALVLVATGGRRLLRGAALSGAMVRTIARFAALAGLSSGLSYLNYRADLFVVERFEGTDGVATYSLAVYLAESVWQVSGSLALATYPRLAGLDRASAAALTARVMRHTVVLLLAVCGVLFLAADVLQAVLFPKYDGMASALRFVLPGVLVYGLAQSYSGFYTYQRGMPWVSAIVAGTGLVLDVALAVTLMPAMGVNGAALASALAYSGAMILALAYFVRGERISPRRIFLFGREEVSDYRVFVERLRAAAGRRKPAPQLRG